MTNLLNKGFHIFLDNFFTSLKLAKYLYSKFTFLTGTLRKSRKGIPSRMKERFNVGETKYMRKGSLLMLGYRQKKSQKNPVLVLSTDASTVNERRSKKRGNQIYVTNKPKMIRQYNDFMGGVDGSDQMLYQYLDDRKTVKYWKKVTFNIFGRMVLNSYIIYKLNTDNRPLSRLDYTVKLVEELSQEWLAFQEDRPILYESTNQSRRSGDTEPSKFFEKLPSKKEKNCCVCSKMSTQAGGKRKKSTFVCTKCKRGLHPKCLPFHNC